jgi:hypothetical protein
MTFSSATFGSPFRYCTKSGESREQLSTFDNSHRGVRSNDRFSADVALSASTANRAYGSLRVQHVGSTPSRRLRGRNYKLGVDALGVTGSYGYGDDYASYDSGRSHSARGVLNEGRAAAIDDESRVYPTRQNWAYESPGSTYGRQTPNYGPGVTFAAPVSPYRWAYSSDQFPGTEFMGGR